MIKYVVCHVVNVSKDIHNDIPLMCFDNLNDCMDFVRSSYQKYLVLPRIGKLVIYHMVDPISVKVLDNKLFLE